ncbi:hypothetical protein ANN_03765 [Periplaneta americana]|uniref:Tc1-like transposase DDE domain-containing protein n=1 Tax=Periplaneta americana TaxID=6978 RepID=A0ABQ8TZV8_PERAM|nr:hypothetical protein ANN_03765 [Periplaneta americana]
MSPGSRTEIYPAYAQLGLREPPGKNLNQVTYPNRDSNPGHLVSRAAMLTKPPSPLGRSEKKRPEKWVENNWFLMHDNAPAHRAIIVKNFLARHNITALDHPPYSPDLSPPDYFLFPRLKSHLKGRRFNAEEVIANATRALRRVSQNGFQASFQELYTLHNKKLHKARSYPPICYCLDETFANVILPAHNEDRSVRYYSVGVGRPTKVRKTSKPRSLLNRDRNSAGGRPGPCDSEILTLVAGAGAVAGAVAAAVAVAAVGVVVVVRVSSSSSSPGVAVVVPVVVAGALRSRAASREQ